MSRGELKPAARAGMTTGKVLPFRRSSVKPQRRRRSPWLALLGPLATASMLVGIPLAIVLWVLSSPRFLLRELTIEGNERVPRRWVEARLAPFERRNLIQLSLPSVALAVEPHPWIQSVDLSKRLPGALRVRVHERRPAALLEKGSRWYFADESGEPIAPVSDKAREKSAYPLITGAARRPEDVHRAIEVGRELRRVRPVWGDGLEKVEVLGEEAFRVYTRALSFPLLVRPGDLERRAEKLDSVLPGLSRRLGGLEHVDLRYSRQIIVEPAAGRSRGREQTIEEK